MGLVELLQRAIVGSTLAVTLAYSAGCGGTKKELPVCEQTAYTEEQFQDAFETAAKRMNKEGYEVRSSLWEDEQRLTLLTKYMVNALECFPVSSIQQALRETSSSCENVSLFPEYKSSASYCGQGAVADHKCRQYGSPGNCLNEICYAHDLCYDKLLQSSADGTLCLWSEQTPSCDADFFAGFTSCLNKDECTFWCRVITAVAAGLTLAELKYDVSPGCLWDGISNGSCCDHPDGGVAMDCFTRYCEETSCAFYDPFDEPSLNTCRWKVEQGAAPITAEGLQLSGASSIVSTKNLGPCQALGLEYRLKLSRSNEEFIVHFPGYISTGVFDDLNPYQFTFSCLGGDALAIAGLDFTQWNTIRAEVQGGQLRLLVNGAQKGTIPCGELIQSTPLRARGTTNFSATFTLDYVTVTCD